MLRPRDLEVGRKGESEIEIEIEIEQEQEREGETLSWRNSRGNPGGPLMKTGALARCGAEPGVWAAGGGGRGRPGPGSPEQQAGAERSRVLQPPRSREPGQHPRPPAVMSAGPLLKGQAARRGSERGLGALDTGWVYRGGAGGAGGAPAPKWTESWKPNNLLGRGDAGAPRGSL